MQLATEKAQEQKLLHKTLATEQKRQLLDLYADRNRPSWDSDATSQLFLLNKKFLNEWRKFIRYAQEI